MDGARPGVVRPMFRLTLPEVMIGSSKPETTVKFGVRTPGVRPRNCAASKGGHDLTWPTAAYEFDAAVPGPAFGQVVRFAAPQAESRPRYRGRPPGEQPVGLAGQNHFEDARRITANA